MRSNLVFCIAWILLVACNNNAQETKVAETQQPQTEIASNAQTSQASDGITGYWKLKLETYDDNNDKILDEAERKKGFRNSYSFRFNADGSCQVQEVYKGRYDVKTEDDNKKLSVYRNRIIDQEVKDPPPDKYLIISISKDELVLLEDMGNLVFWVFERIN